MMEAQAIPRASADAKDRRKTVEARLAAIGPVPAARRQPPPEGRMGADDDPMPRVCEALSDLGPLFASFGRYLSSRVDLVARRDSRELSSIPDRGEPLAPALVERSVALQLGAPLERRFAGFTRNPHDVRLWTERHHAWIASGIPVIVLLVRPDAASLIERDVPLLMLLRPWFDIAPLAFTAAVDDFTATLKRRLDQMQQAAAFAALALDASSSTRGFGAPLCHRDYCAPGLLTFARPSGVVLGDLMIDDRQPAAVHLPGRDHAVRIASAWLHQALTGRLVPFDFGPRDIVVAEERLVLVGGAFEPHTSAARGQFISYLNAVAADDPDAASAWILDNGGSDAPDGREEAVRRRLRQAVPFRDGEWSGDDRLAEQLLVQWRMAHQADRPLSAHHLHVFRGLHATASLAVQLAPQEDALAAALQDERLHMGVAEARRMGDPATLASTIDRVLMEMIHLPQRLDDVLTMASEGKLRVKLHVPDADGSRQTRNRTVLLVALLIASIGVASVTRQLAPALGAGVERLGALALLALGGWLLVASARM
jgi:predicted unusual protein kinase regulating ubiquinone biosynthesis (AarF/ABC1/UbiB family)